MQCTPIRPGRRQRATQWLAPEDDHRLEFKPEFVSASANLKVEL
jgi:hypothetical protein